MKLDYRGLKEKHRELRGSLSDSTGLRIHRGLSWLQVAELTDDLDTRFLLLWISFNSIYAQEFSEENTFGEKGLLNRFIGRLVRLDKDDLIHSIVWENYSNKIRLFINNPYVTRWFWDFQNGKLDELGWKKKFDRSRKDAQQTLALKDTSIFCSILFDRLYVLRNQLMHGGATWQSVVNRAQVKDGTCILETIIPAMIYIMLENPQQDWGSPCFPPIK
jgi:hypothetical protein